MSSRIAFSVILFISILFWPFGLSMLLAIGGMIYFTKFWEAPLLILVSDIFYGFETSRFFGIRLFPFLILVLLFLVIEFLKKKLKFYSK